MGDDEKLKAELAEREAEISAYKKETARFRSAERRQDAGKLFSTGFV